MRRTAQLLRSLLSILLITAGEGIQFLWLAVSSRAELSAEVLFLRKQLAFYREHQVPPRKLTDAARFSLALWSHLFNWRAALVIVKPETLIGWHRKGFKLFWRWKSRLGRPRIPENLRQLIVRMVQENPTWGEERIAAELSVKLGILVSPRTRGRTGRKIGIREAVGEHPRSTGGRLSATTPRPWWPLTFGSHHGWFPSAVRVRGDGGGKSPYSAMQCHRPSDRRLDPAAVSRSYPERSPLPIPDS